MPIEEVRLEVEEWVVDPGSTTGRALAHDLLIMIYWVIMNMVTQATIKVEATKAEAKAKAEGDDVPVQAWKEHHVESGKIVKQLHNQGVDQQLMHRKVDQIATRMGIILFHMGMEKLWDGGPSRQSGGQSLEHFEGRT